MLEHHMDIDPSYQKLQENLNGMQKIQIEQEVVANEEKEQKIQERKNIDEFMRKSFGENYKEKMKRWERGE